MIKYAVMKVIRDFETNIGLTIKADTGGEIHGYIPVFNNEEDAKIASCDGKYGVIAMKIEEENK